VKKVVTVLFGGPLSEVDGMIYHLSPDLVPAHGPGTTADGLIGNRKWNLKTWTDRLESVFPHREFLFPNLRFASEIESIGGNNNPWPTYPVTLLSHADEVPAELIFVPKTQKTPRIIVREPTYNQYVQQAIARPLVQLLEKGYLHGACNPGSYFVGFSEQWPNQAMACIGSEDGSLATLDLSEASDRVPNWLVEELFSNWPHFLEGIQACRSERVRLPDGRVKPIIKFASMGSALTFPIEAMVFTATVVEAVLRARSLSPTLRNLRELRELIRVYGDDIICPEDTTETVIESLENLGFRVNRGKSFFTGRFRESCGKEFWHGADVSIVRVRKSFPSSLLDAEELVSAVETRNQFYKAGMRRTAALYDEALERLMPGRYPIVQETSPLLGRVDDYVTYESHGRDEYGEPVAKGYVVRPKIPRNSVGDEVSVLLKCLIGKSEDSPIDHLTHSGRPRSVAIKRATRRPY